MRLPIDIGAVAGDEEGRVVLLRHREDGAHDSVVWALVGLADIPARSLLQSKGLVAEAVGSRDLQARQAWRGSVRLGWARHRRRGLDGQGQA